MLKWVERNRMNRRTLFTEENSRKTEKRPAAQLGGVENMRKKAKIELDPNLLTAIEEFFKMKVMRWPDGQKGKRCKKIHTECGSELFLS